MKGLIIGICMTFAAMFAVAANAGQVGVVDMKSIFQQSPQVKSINAALTKQFQARKDKIVSMGKQLQANIKDYQKNKDVMGAKALTALKTKITQQEMKLRQAQVKFQQDIYAAQNQQMSKFMANVRKIVKSIAAKKHLDMVLPANTVLYSDSGMNITSDVIAKLR